jgi:hypothetical protein
MASSFTFSGSLAGAGGVTASSGAVQPFLYQDAVDHLCDFAGGNAMDAEQRLVRKAVQAAYQRFVNERNWQYLFTHGRVNLQAAYETGTLDFDYTGGVYDRLVTFSTALSSTVQGWAKYGRIRINDVVYEVDDYKSSTTVTLSQSHTPLADLDDETFTLYRNVYPMPSDFRRLKEPTAENSWYSYYVPPEYWLYKERHFSSAGSPYQFTILPDPDNSGGYAIVVDPYPSAAETLDFIYQRFARRLKYSGYESATRTGTITASNGSTTVTGSGTSWTTDMAGAYMRFIDNTTVPDGLGGLNPYLEERKIRSVTNTTTLILDAPVENGYTAKAFCISDPVDVPTPMWDTFLRCIEWQYAITGRVQGVAGYQQGYFESLRHAFECDAVVEMPRVYGGEALYVNRGWDSPLGDAIE